jgi:cell division protein FtsI/penicillin-binding protein 2
MASYPAFDPADPLPNLKGNLKPEDLDELRNRAIADSYEPGSIFKPFIAALAIDERMTHLEEPFTINGPARAFGSRIIHDTHVYGVLPLHQVISKSSNIGMALLGSRLGNERLHRYVRSYGFGDLTGIGLPGEHPGLLNDFSRWTSFSTNSIPIGQEIAVTALQVVTGFSVFCNGGILYRPRIVRGVISADGETLYDNSRPIAIRRVLEPETAESFRLDALVETVISGTGKSAAILDYQAFGKTGTAQVARGGGGGYIDRQFVGSFVGGAPASNPRVVAIVSIYRPQANGHYGGTVAAPALGEIIADALHYMHVPKDEIAPVVPESMPGSLGD